MINVLLVIFVTDVLAGSAATFGWIVSAQGVGGLAAGLVLAHVGRDLPPGRVFAVSLTLIGIMFLVVVNLRTLAPILCLLALLGIPVVAWLTSMSTLVQGGVEDAFRGRVFGALGTTQSLAMLIGTALASGLSGSRDVILLLCVAGGLLVGAGAISFSLETHGAALQG